MTATGHIPIFTAWLFCVQSLGWSWTVAGGEAPKLAKPTPEQIAWQDMEVGMMVCFGVETYLDKETDDQPTMDVLPRVNPSKLDTDQWVRVAESMGAKYIILVAKHAGGFCLWPTKTTQYSVRSIPWRDGKGDIVRDLSDSCRKRGMALGIYLSPTDISFGAVLGGGGVTKDPKDQSRYGEVYRQQLVELLSQYGPLMEVWFDGSLTAIDVGDILDKYTPKAMIFQGPRSTLRWVGNEFGSAPYPAWNSTSESAAKTGVAAAQHGDPNGTVWLPLECDTTTRFHHGLQPIWFWRTDNAHELRSLDNLMTVYYNSVGRGAVLLLNASPDRTGLIPEADAKRIAEFGAEIQRRLGTGLKETSGEGNIVELDLKQPTVIDHVVVMEDIAYGERVRRYVIEAMADGHWRPIAEGISIGHKNIMPLKATSASKVRIRVLESAATPCIRRLAVYRSAGTGIVEAAPSRRALDGVESPVWRTIGHWNQQSLHDATIDVDVSPYIDVVGQYEIQFRRTEGQQDPRLSAVLLLDGVACLGLVEAEKGVNTFNLNITATPRRKKGSIVLRAVASGVIDSRGEITIRRKAIR